MAKTIFENNVTVLSAEFLHAINGTDAATGHDHLAEPRDGSNPNIKFEELEPSLRNLLNDLSGLRPLIQQLYYGDKVKAEIFGGFGGDGAYTGTYPLTQSVYEFTNFTIPSGTTVLVPNGFTKIRCTGSFTIETGGLLLGLPINRLGIGKPYFNTGGSSYNLGVSRIGSGGGETVDHTDEAGLTTIRDPGGYGGAGIIIEALGNILIDGSIGCNGGNAGVFQILSGNPTLGGSGGGSGGSISMGSYSSIVINGTCDMIGGNGANGYNTNAAGGGGGGGGIFTAIAPEINILVNAVNVSGGLPGTSNGSGIYQGAGGGGFGGNGGNHKQAGSTGIDIRKIATVFNPI